MVITYDKYPLLSLVGENRPLHNRCEVIIRSEDAEVWLHQPEAFNAAQLMLNYTLSDAVLHHCGSNAYVLTQQYIDAFNKSKNAFRKLSKGIELDKLFENCMIMVGGSTYVGYKMTNGPYCGNYLLSMFQTIRHEKGKRSIVAFLGSLVFRKDDEQGYLFEIALLSPMFGANVEEYSDTERFVDQFLGFLIFKHYAKVELDIVQGGQRKKSEIIGDKIVNNTLSDVHVMDSRWYTSVLRTEGFSVRGHFRFYKSCNRMVYINEFQKKGYHRHAKILDDPTAEPDTTALEQALDYLSSEGMIIQ